MRMTLDPGDRPLLIVSGILLVAITVGGIFFVPENLSGLPSLPGTYSTRSTGAKAAYLLLDRLGYKEERWNSPPTQLPQEARNFVLILTDPFEPASQEERVAIQSFVRRGGRVLATGALGARLLNIQGIVADQESEPDWEECEAQLPGPISSRAPAIMMQARVSWKGKQPEGLQYYGDRQGGTVVRFRLGSGTIIWWADSSPLTNYGLTQSANLELLLNSVGEAGNVRVLWDEYFHGDRPDLWSYLSKTPLPWAMLQAALVALALILTYSRRSGPIVDPVAASRLSPMEFVETVGGLYSRKRAAQGAVEIALHCFRSRLARLPRHRAATAGVGTKDALAAGYKDDLSAPALFMSQCDAALTAGISNEAQALGIIQKLHDYTRRLRLADPGE